MATIEQALESLDPPIRHELLCQGGERVSLLLIDPSVPAIAQRSLSKHEVNNVDHFRLIVLHAINELRGQGSHAPLVILPPWD